MPEVTLRHEINTDEDTYWSKLVLDAAYNRKLYAEHLGAGWELLDQKEDDARLTRRITVEPPVGHLPAALKKLLSDKLAYTEDGTFDKKARRYTFKVTPNLQAEKTKLGGEMWVEKLGEKKIARVCKISVDVKIFMVGSMVEDRIVSDLKSSYDRGTQFANDYIAKNGL
ncbi:MAG TPA: DUF2505 family protein [Labilithrix sp.]|jgi:hypothetical protein|nr:DUF2505 family protein [Labilithrix sp.]